MGAGGPVKVFISGCPPCNVPIQAAFFAAWVGKHPLGMT